MTDINEYTAKAKKVDKAFDTIRVTLSTIPDEKNKLQDAFFAITKVQSIWHKADREYKEGLK